MYNICRHIKLLLCCLFRLSWGSIMCTFFVQGSSVLFNNGSDLPPSSVSVYFTQEMLFISRKPILTAIAPLIGEFPAPRVPNVRSGRSTDINCEWLYFDVTVNKLQHFEKLLEIKMSQGPEFRRLKKVKAYKSQAPTISLHYIHTCFFFGLKSLMMGFSNMHHGRRPD